MLTAVDLTRKKTRGQKQIAFKFLYPLPSVTINDMTPEEEADILAAWNDIKSGKAELISSEEMRRQIAMECHI